MRIIYLSVCALVFLTILVFYLLSVTIKKIGTEVKKEYMKPDTSIVIKNGIPDTTITIKSKPWWME